MWVNQKCTSYWGNILMVDKDNQLPWRICISAGKHILHDTWILILASYPQTLAECHWEVFCVAPYSGLLVFGQLWLGAIYNFLKRWTVVTDPNGTGMFLCYGFLIRSIVERSIVGRPVPKTYCVEIKPPPPPPPPHDFDKPLQIIHTRNDNRFYMGCIRVFQSSKLADEYDLCGMIMIGSLISPDSID